jgi:DNA-binding MarR family transcriptional regulator
MRYPGPQNQRPSEIAAEVGMSKQAVNYLLGQLETLGYLKREDHPGDQRSRRIRLTVRGRAAGRQIRKTVMQIEGELERELGAGHFAELRELLVRLNATDTIRGPRPERSRV